MDNCTRGDKPACWRWQLTVTVPMATWDFFDLGERLSSSGQTSAEPLGQRSRRAEHK